MYTVVSIYAELISRERQRREVLFDYAGCSCMLQSVRRPALLSVKSVIMFSTFKTIVRFEYFVVLDHF